MNVNKKYIQPTTDRNAVIEGLDLGDGSLVAGAGEYYARSIVFTTC